jgi:hypothetical protein
MFWGHLLFEEAPDYAWKCVLVKAAEDIGLAAPAVVDRLPSGRLRCWGSSRKSSRCEVSRT